MATSKKTIAKSAKAHRGAKPAAPLTLRELNRALLGRQLLLARGKLAAPAALERIAGLQAQMPGPPYVGLWSRLADFDRRPLADALVARTVVRAPLFRGTLHEVSTADYARFRAVVAPVLHRAFAGMNADRLKGIDAVALSEEARPFLQGSPRTQDDVRNFLGSRHPELDLRMLGHAVRLHLPMVQVPEPFAGSWNYPAMPRFALADAWIGRPLATATAPDELIRRYLAAFGPATARDFQTWCGLSGMAADFERLRPELRVVTDEEGHELFDLPGALRPDATTPAPPRFLPEFDNVLLAHHDRSRIIAEEHRAKVFLPGLRVEPTFLIDGFVAGTWDNVRLKKAVTMIIKPFDPIPPKARDALLAEAERLTRFLEPDVETWTVSLAGHS